jgi:hypothetical protein
VAFRKFTDEQGILWQAWAVAPRPTERRVMDRRREGVLQMATADERRRQPDRRTRSEVRIRVSAGLEAGWIAFESPRGRRRLAPIPTGWESLPEPELAALCRLARPAPRRAGIVPD